MLKVFITNWQEIFHPLAAHSYTSSFSSEISFQGKVAEVSSPEEALPLMNSCAYLVAAEDLLKIAHQELLKIVAEGEAALVSPNEHVRAIAQHLYKNDNS